MKFTVLLLLHLLLPGLLVAQARVDWVRRYDGPENRGGAFYDIFKTAEGGFAMTGATNGRDRFMWLAVTDRNGALIHQSMHPVGFNTPFCLGRTIIQDDEGGYVIGGDLRSDGMFPTKFGIVRTDEDGGLIWWKEYGGGQCNAIIEEKAGNFVACGRGGGGAFVVKVDTGGDTLWTRVFVDDFFFWGLRETEDGYMLVGHGSGGQSLVCHLDHEGEVIDFFYHGRGGLRAIVSCPGGFMAVGSGVNAVIIALKLAQDGDLDWRQDYNFAGVASGVARMPDGGFVICAYAYGHSLLRIDQEGTEQWRREDNEIGGYGWQSIVTLDDGTAYVVGDSNGQGILMKVQPDILHLQYLVYTPVDTIQKVLTGTEIEFTVVPRNMDWNDLNYLWKLGDDTMSIDTLAVKNFDEVGEHIVECRVMKPGEEREVFVRWHVTVTDVIISVITPDTLDLTLRRGAELDFAIDEIRYSPGGEPEYNWTKTDLNLNQSEDLGQNSHATIDFPWSGNYTVEGKVFRDESSDKVIWNVAVRGAIWAYVPEALTLDVEPDSVVHFEIVPSEPENESLSIQWLVDGELAAEDTVALEWAFGIAGGEADSCPPYQVQCVVADSVEADTVTWEVTVRDLAVPHDGSTADPPRSAALLSVSPNPFNSMLTIRFSASPHAIAGGVGGVSLRIYDISGRLVIDLLDLPHSKLQTPNSKLIWDASSVPAGVYLVRLQSGTDVSTQKVVLLR